MANTTKNLLIVLGLIVIAAGGYYMYSQRSATTLDIGVSDETLQDMLMNTQIFIVRSKELDGITLDMAVLEDERFRSLRAFSDQVEEQPAGRPDPFAEVTETSTIR